jgi:hypothetical protein
VRSFTGREKDYRAVSFDLEKMQAVAELGEVIRLQNEAMDRLRAFRQARPYLIMPNLAKMVEENMKENVQVLYKELNNLHKPAEQQTRYICDDCKMAFLVKLPGGICDECRARRGTKPRDYVVNAPPVDVNAPDEEPNQQPSPAPDSEGIAAGASPEAPGGDGVAQMDPSDIKAEQTDISVIATSEGVPVDEDSSEEIAGDAERAATGDKLPIQEEEAITRNPAADVSGPDSQAITQANAAAEGDEEAAEEMSEEFLKFMNGANTESGTTGAAQNDNPPRKAGSSDQTDIFSETDMNTVDDSEKR